MWDSLAPFVLTSIAIELTPGPNMAYLAVLSLDRGRWAGMAAVAGVAVGLAVLGLAAGFGLGVVIAETRWLYEILRWAGVFFLLWLAFDTWRDSLRPVDPAGQASGLAVQFRRGLITNLLNPKAAMFYVAVLPNYFDAARPVAGQLLVLTSLYVAVATAIHAAVVFLADAIKPYVTSPRFRQALGSVFAILLVGIALWLAYSTRRVWS